MFKIDREFDIYERQVYTVIGLLKDVGGFYNSLYFAGLFIFSQFQGSIVFASFISKLYQVEQMNDLEEGDLEEESNGSRRDSIRSIRSMQGESG